MALERIARTSEATSSPDSFLTPATEIKDVGETGERTKKMSCYNTECSHFNRGKT